MAVRTESPPASFSKCCGRAPELRPSIHQRFGERQTSPFSCGPCYESRYFKSIPQTISVFSENPALSAACLLSFAKNAKDEAPSVGRYRPLDRPDLDLGSSVKIECFAPFGNGTLHKPQECYRCNRRCQSAGVSS